MPPLSPSPGCARGDVCIDSIATVVTCGANASSGPSIPGPSSAYFSAVAASFSRRNDS